tara:strand:+ start:119 stop:2173 length:2055 start_codon:yes stop_codon:yes gene_type:complete
MRGRIVIIALLFLIILSSPVFAASEVKTYRDSEYTYQSEYFTDGGTIYILASNSVTCCDDITATISVNNVDKSTITLKDEGNGFYKGNFKINSEITAGFVQMANSEQATIQVEFTPIYKRSSSTTAYYIKPKSTELTAELKDYATLSWDEISPDIALSHYNIYRSTEELTDANKKLADTFTTAVDEYEDSTTRDGKTYCYGVSAVDIAGNIAELSNVECLDLEDETAPSSVTGLTATPIQGGRIKISWKESEDNVAVNEYNIYKLKEEDDEIDLDDPDEAVLETEYIDEKLKDGKTYYYTVSAVDTSENIGPASPVVSAVSDKNPPTESALTAERQRGGKVVLSWTEIYGAEYYYLYAGTSKALEVEPVVLSGDTLTHTHFPQAETFYAVSAVDSAGNEAELSNILSITPDSEPPKSVTGLSAVANPDNSITLTWTESTDKDFKQYNIYRSAVSSISFSVPIKITTLNSFTDRELNHNQQYFYVVRAEDEAGNEDNNQRSVSETARDLNLKLEVVQPSAEIRVSQDMLVVAGITDPDAIMSISGITEDILIDDNGGFLTIIPLISGEQEIIVRATDPNDNVKTEILKVNNRKDEISADAETIRKEHLNKLKLLSETAPGQIQQLNIEASEDILKQADPEVNIGEVSQITGLVTGSRGGIWSSIIGFIFVGGIIAVLYGKKKGLF